MIPIICIILASIFILKIEAPRLLKAKMHKEFKVLIFLLSISFSMVIARGILQDVPNPLNGIAFLLRPLTDILVQILR